MTNPPPPPGWYPDQQAPQLLRWWDGQAWTSGTQPAQQTQTPPGRPGTLFTEPVLRVNQRVKLVELTNEYTVFDREDRRIGSVVEVGQGVVQKAVRLFSKYDDYMTHRFEVRDAGDSTVFKVMRPAKALKSKFLVTRPDDSPIGEIIQVNVLKAVRFDFVVNGQVVGGITASNWLDWNFSITDHTNTEIARMHRTMRGLDHWARWDTTADNYFVEIPRPLQDPLASLVVAAALTIDTALSQFSVD